MRCFFALCAIALVSCSSGATTVDVNGLIDLPPPIALQQMQAITSYINKKVASLECNIECSALASNPTKLNQAVVDILVVDNLILAAQKRMNKIVKSHNIPFYNSMESADIVSAFFSIKRQFRSAAELCLLQFTSNLPDSILYVESLAALVSVDDAMALQISVSTKQQVHALFGSIEIDFFTKGTEVQTTAI